MKDEKTRTVVKGLLIVILGILIAIFGAGTVIDLYVGIGTLVLGLVMLMLAVVTLKKKEPLPFGWLVLGVTMITFSVALLTNYVSVSVLVQFLVLSVLALGIASLGYGVYVFVKNARNVAIAFWVFGVFCTTLSILYMTVSAFQTAFWIVTGILIAIAGALVMVGAFVDYEKLGKKKKRK